MIRGRAWNDARQARRFPHVAWNAAANDESSDRIEIQILEARADDQLDAPVLALPMQELAAELREQVADSPAARAILDCWADGVVECTRSCRAQDSRETSSKQAGVTCRGAPRCSPTSSATQRETSS